MQETQLQSLGGEDALEKGMETHFSILAWRIPIDRGAWQATVHGVTPVRHNWRDLACIHWLWLQIYHIDCILQEPPPEMQRENRWIKNLHQRLSIHRNFTWFLFLMDNPVKSQVQTKFCLWGDAEGNTRPWHWVVNSFIWGHFTAANTWVGPIIRAERIMSELTEVGLKSFFLKIYCLERTALRRGWVITQRRQGLRLAALWLQRR